jgi:hypothetical protein
VLLFFAIESKATIPGAPVTRNVAFTLSTSEVTKLVPKDSSGNATGEKFTSLVCYSSDTTNATYAGDKDILTNTDGLAYCDSCAMGAVIAKDVSVQYAYAASGTPTLTCEFAIK